MVTKRISLCLLSQRIVFLIFFLSSSSITFADSYYKYVGETFYLPIPSVPSSNAVVSSWSFSCTDSHIRITNGGSSEPSEAVITSYFSGSVIIECYYSYTSYFNGYPHGGTGKAYHTVTCRSNDISISANKRILQVGETMQMSYKFSTITYESQPVVKWESNSDAVTVDRTGYVVARKSGRATISASSNLGGNIARYDIEVEKNDPTDISIPYSLTAYVGETTDIDVSLYPSDAETTLSWYNTNQNIASVSNSSITGKDEGKTTIYCVTSNGISSNDCEVTVYYRTATGVKISSSTLSVPIGESRTLSCTPVPSNARTSVTWESDNPSVATVSQSGIVQGIKQGHATISVTTDNGYKASCDVTVPPDPDKISIPEKVSLYLGRTRTLKLAVLPSEAYCKCQWNSSDKSVATVTSEGKVTAVHPGNTVISVKSQNGKTASCKLEVPEPSFKLNVWYSSGEQMAFPLSEHPVITEKDGVLVAETKKMSVSIAASDLRKFTIADEFTNELPTKISLPSELTIEYKERRQLDCLLYPTDYDIETTLQWTSSDTRTATVSSTGAVTGIHPGECYITVTASNGKTSSCHVTVLGHDAYLVLWQWNGEQVKYHLGTYPRIKYSDGRLIVISDEVELSYPATDVRKFTLDGLNESPTGIDEIYPDNGEFGFTMSKGRPGSTVNIYTIDGHLLDTFAIGDDGELHYSLDNMPAGIYIISTESTKLKILKK